MTWGDAMKDIKEKPTAHMPRSNATGEIPKAALKKAWAEAKEKSRTMLRESTSTQGDGDYTTAQDTSSVVTDTSYSVIKQNTDFTVQQGRKIARKQIEKYRERRSAEQTETIRVHTANERGVSPKQVECSTLSDAERHPRRGADLPRQRAKEKVVTAKTAPRDIRGVTQGQRQLRTAANETVRSITTQAQMQTRTRQVQLAIQKAASSTCKTAVAVRSAIRHFLVGLHSLVAAIAAGISVALSIIIVISLVAFVSGSAYGIFFAANAPNADTITVQQAVETLTAEYRDRLEEISDTVQHDRQDITANDDVYYIRWQDVLAVFSSYVSGNEQGTPVAALTEEQVDKLRETMWAMNAVDCSTHPETTTIETTDEDGNPTTTEITETVLVIELTHKTPDEMAADYHFTTRQNTYLQLLQDPQYEELWAELLGGFAQGGGELMNPDSTRIPTGTLQWPLPVAGTITSQFGHRVDPITGEVSSHTGTDIACAEGTPILAAADGVVTVANGLDSWGGSYGYYIQIDHGGGLETLYAHCSSICVTTGQQVQAGQVIGYVGHTGRATGSHLHFEMQLIREGSAGVGIFTQTVAHHPVDSVVGLKPQHIAQIIMFAVPDQQPLSGSVFPEEGILVLVQRIHTVVAVNIREEELHTVFNHGVTVAHGESIDIGCHGCVNFCAERLQLVLPFGQTLAEYIRIDKIIEVQIVGRNTDFAFLDKTGKVSAVVLTGLFPELLYAVQRFAVPAEVSIFRLTHHGQHGFDIVDLNCNNAFLQIRVAYVRVGMMDNIDRLDGMCHDKIPPNI